MPQLIPFFYIQELVSVLFVIFLLTIFISFYTLPIITLIHSIRRYLTSI